ncbi:hypothetical protein C8J56DRAFT_880923 [Mycena floridula]|nr:hypothetical protein C8J56DRAFT_880923 [Mycena floridula]
MTNLLGASEATGSKSASENAVLAMLDKCSNSDKLRLFVPVLPWIARSFSYDPDSYEEVLPEDHIHPDIHGPDVESLSKVPALSQLYPFLAIRFVSWQNGSEHMALQFQVPDVLTLVDTFSSQPNWRVFLRASKFDEKDNFANPSRAAPLNYTENGKGINQALKYFPSQAGNATVLSELSRNRYSTFRVKPELLQYLPSQAGTAIVLSESSRNYRGTCRVRVVPSESAGITAVPAESIRNRQVTSAES